MYRDNQKLVIKLMSNLYLIHMVSKVIIIKNFIIDCIILIMYRTHPKLVIGKQRSNIIDMQLFAVSQLISSQSYSSH